MSIISNYHKQEPIQVLFMATTMVKKIRNNIRYARKEIVTIAYNEICKLCEDDQDNNLIYAQKLDYIRANVAKLTEDELKNIDDKMTDAKIEHMKKVLLEVINEILEAIGELAIDEITDFKDVSRDLMLTDECRQVVSNNRIKIIDAEFGRNFSALHGHKAVKNEHLIVLKQMCKRIGLTMIAKHTTKIIDKQRICITKYYIK